MERDSEGQGGSSLDRVRESLGIFSAGAFVISALIYANIPPEEPVKGTAIAMGVSALGIAQAIPSVRSRHR